VQYRFFASLRKSQGWLSQRCEKETEQKNIEDYKGCLTVAIEADREQRWFDFHSNPWWLGGSLRSLAQITFKKSSIVANPDLPSRQ